MKSYTYTEQDFGLTKFPEGILRLDGVEAVTDPAQADIFIIPPSLMHLQARHQIAGLKYMNYGEERHVAFDVSDFDQTYSMKCLFIRCNLKWFMKEKDPNSIPWAWPVEDFKECIELPEGGFKYDVGYHAWIKSHIVREKAGNSCLSHNSLKRDFSMYPDFTGYIYYTTEGIRRRAEFRRSMRESRVSLCPQSIDGVFPYRFFEAMSAGRVAALFCSGYNLPFEKEIPYHEFALMHKAEEAEMAGSIIYNFVNTHSDEQIVEMGKKARHYWELYLNREDWHTRTMTYAVKQKLEALGVKMPSETRS
jgi:hypothetical protein